jgi:hypothetical protein
MASSINPSIQHRMPGSDGRSCYTCTHVSIADLAKDRVWCPRTRLVVMGVPHFGCCQYEREPGSDDEIRLAPNPNAISWLSRRA